MKSRFLFFAIFCAALVLLQVPVVSTAVAEAKKEEVKKEVVPFAYTNAKGKTYYLFSRQQKVKNSDKTFTMYFFASDPKNKKGTPLAKVPDDREVSETKSGLPVLKKKKKK